MVLMPLDLPQLQHLVLSLDHDAFNPLIVANAPLSFKAFGLLRGLKTHHVRSLGLRVLENTDLTGSVCLQHVAATCGVARCHFGRGASLAS